MSSRIEQIIEEIEEYIDSCKFQPLSTTKIIVNKDQMDELLRELRMKTPDEIKRYQKIIANKDAILADARTKAESMLEEAQIHTNELVSEHEIMQQAYAQANDIVTAATEQAQQRCGGPPHCAASTGHGSRCCHEFRAGLCGAGVFDHRPE